MRKCVVVNGYQTSNGTPLVTANGNAVSASNSRSKIRIFSLNVDLLCDNVQNFSYKV